MLRNKFPYNRNALGKFDITNETELLVTAVYTVQRGGRQLTLVLTPTHKWRHKMNLRHALTPLTPLSSKMSVLLYANHRWMQHQFQVLKVLVKNSKGVLAYVEKCSMVIAANLTSICCVYKEKIVKNNSFRRT